MTKTVTPGEPDDQSERAAFVADLRTFADFLARNPWAALPYPTMQADLRRDAPDFWNGGVDGVAELRRIADGLDEKPDESLDDRTQVIHRFGSVEYRVITWHKNGRPHVPDERDAELERLRAENAVLRGAAALGIDPTGLVYTRADTDEDDPTPVSPARVPLHTGGVVDGGQLVDETGLTLDGHAYECCGKVGRISRHEPWCEVYTTPDQSASAT